MNSLVTAACALALVLAQDPKPAPAPAPAPTPVAAPTPTPADVARAEALLRQHGARTLGAKVVVADYVQRRTTELLKEPLVSKGRLLFRREPAVVVFFAAEPRPSVVRLAELVYEVHRPQRKQLERFHLEGPELARGLFAAVGGDVDRLLRDFAVAAVVDGPKERAVVQVQLAPKDAAVQARVRGLDLTLRSADGALVEVAYRDQAGDRVAIEMTGAQMDPKDAPSAELQLAPDTNVLEHRPKPAPK